MVKVVEAIYVNGVFKPLQKVDLKDGEKVRLRIEKRGIHGIIEDYRKYFEDVDEDLTEILSRERR